MAQAARSTRRRPGAAGRRRSLSGYGSRDVREALATWSTPLVGAGAMLTLYVLGLLDVVETTPALAIDALLLIAIVLYFPMRYAHRLDARGRAAAAAFAVAWLAVIYTPIFLRIFPGPRLASSTVNPDTLPLTLPVAGQGRVLDVIIDGDLGEVPPGRARVATYSVTFAAEGIPAQTVSGEFKESWTRNRQGRRDAVDVLTERVARQASILNPANGDLRVEALDVTGQENTSLTLSVYRHRLPPAWVAALAAIGLLVGAAIFDRATAAGETAASMAVATGTALTGAFAFPSIGSPHPTFRELAGAAIVGGLVGGPIGGLVGWTFRRRFPSVAPRSRARGR